jgi:hypothetical protein
MSISSQLQLNSKIWIWKSKRKRERKIKYKRKEKRQSLGPLGCNQPTREFPSAQPTTPFPFPFSFFFQSHCHVGPFDGGNVACAYSRGAVTAYSLHPLTHGARLTSTTAQETHGADRWALVVSHLSPWSSAISSRDSRNRNELPLQPTTGSACMVGVDPGFARLAPSGPLWDKSKSLRTAQPKCARRPRSHHRVK